jgi:hypothetical protein
MRSFRRGAARILRHPVVGTLVIVAAFGVVTLAWAFAFFIITWCWFGDAGPSSGFEEMMGGILFFGPMVVFAGLASWVAGRIWGKRVGTAVAVICSCGLVYSLIDILLGP